VQFRFNNMPSGGSNFNDFHDNQLTKVDGAKCIVFPTNPTVGRATALHAPYVPAPRRNSLKLKKSLRNWMPNRNNELAPFYVVYKLPSQVSK